MLKGIGAPEILLILVVLVLLFGAKRLPDTARALGKSMRIFKAETKAMHDEPEAAPPAAPHGLEGVPTPASTPLNTTPLNTTPLRSQTRPGPGADQAERR